jgi:hypothetical protein
MEPFEKWYKIDANHNVSKSTMTESMESKRKYGRVAWSDLGEKGVVSTVFLGLDHNYADDGEPHVFETMYFPEVFGDSPDNCNGSWEDGHQERCSTWVEAQQQHKRVVADIINDEDKGE